MLLYCVVSQSVSDGDGSVVTLERDIVIVILVDAHNSRASLDSRVEALWQNMLVDMFVDLIV
jgi:hypothetical protein